MQTVKEVLHDSESKMKKTVEAAHRDFSTVRTGRASTALVERIKVDYYGTEAPLKQLANISTPDPRQVVIQPWDPSSLADIEKAIMKSDLGITPTNDGKVIRLAVPSLTQERRDELAKVIKKITESGKVSLRSARHAANETVDKLEKEKMITEDEKFKGHKDIQAMIDKYSEQLEKIHKDKEKDIQSV